MTTLVIDCTELYQNPVRTGIQRVVRELLRHWPYGRIRARVARFDPAKGLLPLPEQAIRILTDEARGAAAMSRDALVNALQQVNEKPEPLPPDPRIFIPEVFYDHARCRFYAGRQPAMLAYDFLPCLRPGLFGSSSVAGLMPYLRLLSTVPHVAYISEHTRREYETRIARRPAAGPVLPLGADGLQIERQVWHNGRAGYVSLGSLDTRKKQHLIAEAFIRLWEGGHNPPLTLIGRAFEGHKIGWLNEARRFPQFRWLDGATDADVANALRGTRATIYVSEAEGFGLPPVESVAAGVPVIAAVSCPSVAMLQSAGALLLDPVTPDGIAAAVLALEDDATAAALWQGAVGVRLGTWRDFARATAEWLDGGGFGGRDAPPLSGVPTGERLITTGAAAVGLTRIRFEEIDQTIVAASAARSEPERIAELCHYFTSLPEGLEHLAQLDPFSAEYRAGMLQVLALITLRPDYEPERDEAANYLPASGEGYLPSAYQSGDSSFLGEFLQAWGGVLKALDLRRGARVLEYGAGEGQIAVQLARMGCDVTVVDIERRYLEIIESEAKSLHVSVATLHGRFGDGPEGMKFDAILFFEAFHHALDHLGLLPRLRDRLAPNGRIVFAGEPILEPDSHWAPTLPYPWGPRLDALSLCAMRSQGWCELGFARDYFGEALMRAGLIVRFQPSAGTARGAAYIAQAHNGVIEMGEPILVGANGRHDEWHAPEGTHRWTAAEEVVLPLDQSPGWTAVSLHLANWLPVRKRIRVIAGSESNEVMMQPGEIVELTVPLRDAPPRILLRCVLTGPGEYGPTTDSRSFGIAVQRITYHCKTV